MLGDRLSATWRSILRARDFLEMGIRVRIGNGQDTSIWSDAWLRSAGSGRILTTCSMSSIFPEKVGYY